MGWANWPARLQQLHDGPLFEMLPGGSELWIDGGHNPSAARLIASHARKSWRDELPLVLLFASLVTKDAAGVLSPFRGIATEVLTLPIDGHECRSPEDLASLASSQGFASSPHRGLADALVAVEKPSRILIFGSLYLAGEALSLNGTIPD